MTVMVDFLIYCRKVLRLVIKLYILLRLVMVWSSLRSPWMQMTWLLRSSTFQFSWMYWLPNLCLKSLAKASFLMID